MNLGGAPVRKEDNIPVSFNRSKKRVGKAHAQKRESSGGGGGETSPTRKISRRGGTTTPRKRNYGCGGNLPII